LDIRYILYAIYFATKKFREYEQSDCCDLLLNLLVRKEITRFILTFSLIVI